jgi:acyl-CoA synthetase (AMP-forming)/AMP-acid ligase II
MVPINTRLAAPEIAYILEDSGAVALFIDATMAHHLTALDGRMAGVREVIWLDDIASPDGMLHYEDLTPTTRPRMSAPATTTSPACSTPAARPGARRA